MNTKKITILTMLLLVVVTVGSSACSLTKTNAQSPNNRTETTRSEVADSTMPAYKPPKRISKDIIKTEEKTEKTTKNKQKK